LFLQKQKRGAELHIYLEEGTFLVPSSIYLEEGTS
jgi:hypothetical protein